MKKYLIIGCLVLFLTFISGCSTEVPEGVAVDPEVIIGTWENSNETERISLTLNSNGSFEFVGYGNANEEEEIGEVMLKEIGTYTLEGAKLVLDIEDVESSGLDYGDYVADDLGDLNFYVTMSDNNQEMELIETDGNVTYNLKKVDE